MNYLVSDKTAAKLKQLIGETPGSSGGSSAPGGVRQVLWVLIETDEGEGVYTGKPTAYDAEGEDWNAYDTVNVIEANDELLEVGKRYLGIRHGTDEEGEMWFVVWNLGLECLEVVTDVTRTPTGYSYSDELNVTKRCIEFAGEVDSDCCDQCPRCTKCNWAVLILNSNNCTDDDFDLSMNGEVIASIPEIDASCTCPDPTGCRGNLVIGPGSNPCGTEALASQYCQAFGALGPVNVRIAPELNDVADCTLNFRLVSTSNNGCGNFGTIVVFRVCRDTSGPYCCVVLNTSYSGDSGNTDNTFTVNNECCGLVEPPVPSMAMTAKTETPIVSNGNNSPVKAPKTPPVNRPLLPRKPCPCKENKKSVQK